MHYSPKGGWEGQSIFTLSLQREASQLAASSLFDEPKRGRMRILPFLAALLALPCFGGPLVRPDERSNDGTDDLSRRNPYLCYAVTTSARCCAPSDGSTAESSRTLPKNILVFGGKLDTYFRAKNRWSEFSSQSCGACQPSFYNTQRYSYPIHSFM